MFERQVQARADERTVELIAARVTAALREDIEALVAAFAPPENPNRTLTVDQLAARLGVARSTVYAHWREWGGYKLGTGEKAPIRFDASHLSVAPHAGTQSGKHNSHRAKELQRKRRMRRALITDTPRFTDPLEEAG